MFSFSNVNSRPNTRENVRLSHNKIVKMRKIRPTTQNNMSRIYNN